MKQKLSVILITISLCSWLACWPPTDCTDAKCTNSDVYTEIRGSLSGNLDSIINVGDTIRFYMKIPDTMQTNYGDIIFGRLLPGSFFDIKVQSFDSIGSNPNFNFYNFQTVQPINLKSGLRPDGISITWNHEREYECLIIPNHSGKYTLDLFGGIITMATNDRTWLVNPSIVPPNNLDLHHEMYVNWYKKQDQESVRKALNNYIFRYCFEVK